MKFTPAEDYESLKKQALALAGLVNTQERIISALKSMRHNKMQRYNEAIQTLESERDANAMLTAEIELLTKKLETRGDK